MGWKLLHQNIMPVSSKMSESQSLGIEPMQIDVTQFRRITPEEK